MATPFTEPKTNDEAQRLKTFLERGAAVSLEPIKTFELAGPLVATLEQPVTLKFEVVGSDLKGLVGDDPAKRLLLTLDIGPAVSPRDYLVRLFVGNPDATLETPAEDPSSSGGFAFFCEPDSKDPVIICPTGTEPLRTQLDLSAALTKLADIGAGFLARLVLVPLVEKPSPDASVTTRQAQLAVVQSVVKVSG